MSECKKRSLKLFFTEIHKVAVCRQKTYNDVSDNFCSAIKIDVTRWDLFYCLKNINLV